MQFWELSFLWDYLVSQGKKPFIVFLFGGFCLLLVWDCHLIVLGRLVHGSSVSRARALGGMHCSVCRISANPPSKLMSNSWLHSTGRSLSLSALGSAEHGSSSSVLSLPRYSLFQALGSCSQSQQLSLLHLLISSPYFIDFTHLLITSLLVSSLFSLYILIIVI